MNAKALWKEYKLLGLLIIVEALMFSAFYNREIAPYPPQVYDQAIYLAETYRLQEEISTNGLGAIWHELWNPNHAGTLALPIEGALFGLIIGGTRFPQLCVLFVGFCALQIFAFSTAKIVFRNRFYGWMLLGLVLAQSTIRYHGGGLYDFRIDFLAYSLYGIWVCAIMRSSLFADRRWSIGCGLIAAFLVLNRFLSVIYIVGVSLGLAAFFALIWLRNRSDTDLAHQMRKRFVNLAFMFTIFALIVVPVLYINWATIYGKYGYSQFVYEKDIRARQFGIFTLGDHLLFYPRSILTNHLGQSFLWASVIGLAGALFARFFRTPARVPDSPDDHTSKTFLLQVIFLLGAICGPIVLLTIDVSKSPVIGGIVGVPTAMLVVLLGARIASVRHRKFSRAHQTLVASSFVVFLIGLLTQVNFASRHAIETVEHRDLKRVAELNKWLVEYAIEHNWHTPTISFDVISGWFFPQGVITSGYEQTRELVNFQPGLGNGIEIMGVDRSQALSYLAKSDFVVLTTLPKAGLYPFYQKISTYWNDLKDWADKNLIMGRRILFDNFTVSVYVRPSATISNISAGWITSQGISILTDRQNLERFPQIRLSGPARFSWLPKMPTVTVTVETGAVLTTLPSSLRALDQRYEILVDASSIKDQSSNPVQVSLRCDTFFVPKKLGINTDERELVLPAPDSVQLLRKP